MNWETIKLRVRNIVRTMRGFNPVLMSGREATVGNITEDALSAMHGTGQMGFVSSGNRTKCSCGSSDPFGFGCVGGAQCCHPQSGTQNQGYDARTLLQRREGWGG